jgi:hypothetical protein
VFIDEIGATTKMARMRGRSKRGERCRAPIPHGHWKTTTFTGGLRLSGITAPMVLDGPMTGPAFVAYVEQVLVPDDTEKASKRGRFAETKIGCVHIDSCEFRHAEGRLVMFLAIDRVSKFTYVEFHDKAGKMNGAAFLRSVVQAFPYKIHTVLTDNGMAFADLPKYRSGSIECFSHIFDRVCGEHGIEHRLTKPYHPWTNGQAERMNRTVKDATVKAFHYEDRESLKAHVLAFVTAYNFAKHLKALRWKTPFQAICDAWTKEPSIFKINPHHLIPGPHT